MNFESDLSQSMNNMVLVNDGHDELDETYTNDFVTEMN